MRDEANLDIFLFFILLTSRQVYFSTALGGRQEVWCSEPQSKPKNPQTLSLMPKVDHLTAVTIEIS